MSTLLIKNESPSPHETMKYGTIRYDTVEVENGLYTSYTRFRPRLLQDSRDHAIWFGQFAGIFSLITFSIIVVKLIRLFILSFVLQNKHGGKCVFTQEILFSICENQI